MSENNIIIATGIAVLVIIGAVAGISMYPTQTTAQTQLPMADDAVTIDLGYKRLRPGHFMLLYDSTPHLIDHGHIALHVDCDENTNPEVVVVAGIAPNVSPVDLEYVEPLSNPGDMCTYHGDIPAGTTDIAILNPNEDERVRLAPESSITIHAMHPIEPSTEGHGHE